MQHTNSIREVEEVARSQVEHPASPVARFGADEPLRLDAGVALAPFQIGYQTYGTLNGDKSNAILICHALTGDQHVASTKPVTGKPGWWSMMVGPGLPIDTDRFFVICANVLGGCMGTTGPASIEPMHRALLWAGPAGDHHRDMVRAQCMLVDRLGIDRLLAVVGRLDGRHAGAAMGGKLSRARLRRGADRLRGAPFLTEHCVPRSGRQAVMADRTGQAAITQRWAKARARA
jgi:homoserine O-acetyltransferase